MNFRNVKIASGFLASVLVLTPMSTVLAANSAMVHAPGLPTKQVQYQSGVFTVANGTAAVSQLQALQGTVNPLVSSGQAKCVQATDPNKMIHLGFVLKPRNVSRLEAIASSGNTVTPQQYQADFAPTSHDVQTVQNFLKQGNLQIVSQSSDYLLVQGTVAQVEKALHVMLNDYQTKDSRFYANANNPVLPTDVAAVVSGILGLDGQTFKSASVGKTVTGKATASITPDAIRNVYGLNSASLNGIDGTKQSIAILGSGGFNNQDVQQFSDTFGIPYNDQQFIHQSVFDGQPPQVDDLSTLQVEWAHAIAPGATITEYDTGSGDDWNVFEGLDMVTGANHHPNANVVEMDVTRAETRMFPSDLAVWHTKLLEAVAQGITIVVPSGDQGAYNGGYELKDVTFPASDPYVLAVGGTSLTLDDANKRTAETAWGEADLQDWQPYETLGSGGGYSAVFDDSFSGTSQKRRVPDVSMPAQNIEMYASQDGGWMSGSGTSFAAPMWSGMIALAAQKAKHGFGWIRPAINNIATNPSTSGVFQDITEGDNGGYSAAKGWDEVTGWGSPASAATLVQALSTQRMNQPNTRPTIVGTVVEQNAAQYAQLLYNGVDTADIIGTGFGEKKGTVTLTDAHGKSYTVPVLTWTDSDITLDISQDPNSLFQQANAPHKAGTYNLTVKLPSGVLSNKVPVTLSDFLYVTTDSEKTNVSGKENPIYKNITITAIGPDGNPDETGPTEPLTVSLNYRDQLLSPDDFDFRQNGQPLTGTEGGLFGSWYQIQMVNGQANLQLATSKSDDFYTILSGDQLPTTYGYLDFTNQGEKGTHLMDYYYFPLYAPIHTSSVAGTNALTFKLEDQYGNVVPASDKYQVVVTGVSGQVKINGSSYSDSTPVTGQLDDEGYGDLAVQDDTPEQLVVTITDTTDSSVTPVQIPLTFTGATHAKIQFDQGTETSLVSASNGQEPNWQYLHVTLLDANEQTVSCDCGDSYFAVENMAQDLVSPKDYTLQAQVDGQWVTVDNSYKFTFKQGAVSLRVSALHPGAVKYVTWTRMSGDAYLDDEENVEFKAGSFAKLDAVAQLPRMATSSADNPQYAPVAISTTDSSNNVVSAGDDTIAMTEAANGPAVTVAEKGINGNMQPLQPTNGAWMFGLTDLQDNRIYVSSVQPGQAQLTLTDTTNTAIQAADFQIDFVNSMVKKMQAVAPAGAFAKTGTQTVELDLLDANGQKVIGTSDEIALSIKASYHGVKVTDENDTPLQPDKSGRYVVKADLGAAIFHVMDNTGERVSYTFTDLAQPSLGSATTAGTFSQLNKLEFADKTIAATGSLKADDTKTVTVTALDQYNQPMANTTVYLSMNVTDGRGTASVGNVSLTKTPQPFVTNPQGQVVVTYQVPDHLPGTGTDTITVQDDGKVPHVKASVSYTYTSIGKLAFSSAVIAPRGSLSAKGTATVTLTAYDAQKHVLANTVVYLSMRSVGGTAMVGDKAVTDQPQAFYTDSDGHIQILYTAPDPLPKTGSERIIAQVLPGMTSYMVTTNYSF